MRWDGPQGGGTADAAGPGAEVTHLGGPAEPTPRLPATAVTLCGAEHGLTVPPPETPTCAACLEIIEAQRRHPDEMARSLGLMLTMGKRDPELEQRYPAARFGREMAERLRARVRAERRRRGMKKGRCPASDRGRGPLEEKA